MRWPECGTTDAGAPRDELDLAASMITSCNCNGPHARHSPSHEQPGLYLRSARRFLQAPRENDAAQPFLADLGGFLDQRFGGDQQTNTAGPNTGRPNTGQSKRPNTGQSKKSESRKGWSAERWRELCESEALREA